MDYLFENCYSVDSTLKQNMVGFMWAACFIPDIQTSQVASRTDWANRWSKWSNNNRGALLVTHTECKCSSSSEWYCRNNTKNSFLNFLIFKYFSKDLRVTGSLKKRNSNLLLPICIWFKIQSLSNRLSVWN